MCIFISTSWFQIDRIEYDVTVQTSAVQHGVCMRVCARACAVEIKPGMLRDACFIDVHVWTRTQFDLQGGDFHSKKRGHSIRSIGLALQDF